jgi:VIT1/CCC1 family predicted Fe2+/Mn2+ transporter
MPDPIEMSRVASREAARAADPRPWIWRNERFLRAIFMIATYVFGAIFLISIFLLGTFALISAVLAGMCLASLVIIIAMSVLKSRRR